MVNKMRQYKASGSILAPGCGLGRLVLELVLAGYSAQGNEVTYFMLYGSNFILNSVEREGQHVIYPFINCREYLREDKDQFREVTLPDRVSQNLVPEGAEFSMVAGEFVEVYSEMHTTFDGVCTLFFLDTAHNVFSYVDTIWKCLKENGVWVNMGPLLFHFKEISH